MHTELARLVREYAATQPSEPPATLCHAVASRLRGIADAEAARWDVLASGGPPAAAPQPTP